MADGNVTIEVNRADLGVICNGLVMARASALRLANRLGQAPDVVKAYKAEYDKVSGVLMRLTHYATVADSTARKDK